MTALCWGLLAAASCAKHVAGASTAAPSTPSATSAAVKPLRSGTLITYKAGRELGRDEYEDDGETLISRLSFGARKGTVRISRTSRSVVVEEGSQRVEREIPPGAVALENGDWQAYAVAAEQYADATEPRAVKVLVPGQGAELDGTIAVMKGAEGKRDVKVTIGSLVALVTIDADGKVVEAKVPAQKVEVRRTGEAPPSSDQPSRAATPPNAIPRLVHLSVDGGTLAAEVWSPKGANGPVPLAVIVPGSGPTDRDGNSTLGLRTDAYQQLASALVGRGIATLRYDKRGIGQSQGHREESITLTSSAQDLAALIRETKSKEPFSSVTLVGHSEGGVVALKALEDVLPAALVLIAVPGRPLGTVLRDQLTKRGVPASDIDKALLDIRKGDAVAPAFPALRAIFRPSVLPFLRSTLDVDPAALVRGTTLPLAVVQGDSDRQLSVDDAQLLHAARPDARLVIVKNMSHVLKDDPSQSSPQRSYTDPTMPLAAPVIDVIAEMAKR